LISVSFIDTKLADISECYEWYCGSIISAILLNILSKYGEEHEKSFSMYYIIDERPFRYYSIFRRCC